MNPEPFVESMLAVVQRSALLERLLFCSLEFAVLALAVGALILLLRLRQPRLRALLWLMVLAKPLVGLAVGTPLPLFFFGAPLPAAPLTAAAAPAPLAPLALAQPGPAPEPIPTAMLTPLEPAGNDDPPAPASALAGPAAAPAPVAETHPLDAAALLRGVQALWLAGCVLLALRLALSYVRLRRLIRAAAAPAPWLAGRLAEAARALNVARPPRLLVTAAVESPALAGFWRPVILVPDWVAAEADPARVDWSLRHELMHWRLRDPLAAFVAELVLILFFFHPAAWWARRKWKEATELACDRALIRSLDDAAAYAEELCRMLVLMRQRRRMAIAGGLFAGRTQLARRIASLARDPLAAPAHLSALGFCAVLALSVASMLFGVGASSRAEDTAQALTSRLSGLPCEAHARSVSSDPDGTTNLIGDIRLSFKLGEEEFVLIGDRMHVGQNADETHVEVFRDTLDKTSQTLATLAVKGEEAGVREDLYLSAEKLTYNKLRNDYVFEGKVLLCPSFIDSGNSKLRSLGCMLKDRAWLKLMPNGRHYLLSVATASEVLSELDIPAISETLPNDYHYDSAILAPENSMILKGDVRLPVVSGISKLILIGDEMRIFCHPDKSRTIDIMRHSPDETLIKVRQLAGVKNTDGRSISTFWASASRVTIQKDKILLSDKAILVTREGNQSQERQDDSITLVPDQNRTLKLSPARIGASNDQNNLVAAPKTEKQALPFDVMKSPSRVVNGGVTTLDGGIRLEARVGTTRLIVLADRADFEGKIETADRVTLKNKDDDESKRKLAAGAVADFKKGMTSDTLWVTGDVLRIIRDERGALNELMLDGDLALVEINSQGKPMMRLDGQWTRLEMKDGHLHPNHFFGNMEIVFLDQPDSQANLEKVIAALKAKPPLRPVPAPTAETEAEKARVSPADRQAAKDLLAQANRLKHTSNMRESVRLLQEALKKDPTNADAWAKLGQIQSIDRVKNPEAWDAYANALKYDPHNVLALHGIAEIYYHEKRPEEAAKYFERALKVEPGNLSVFANMVGMYVGLGDSETARKHLERMKAIDPADIRTRGAEKQIQRLEASREGRDLPDLLFDDLMVITPDPAHPEAGQGVTDPEQKLMAFARKVSRNPATGAFILEGEAGVMKKNARNYSDDAKADVIRIERAADGQTPRIDLIQNPGNPNPPEIRMTQESGKAGRGGKGTGSAVPASPFNVVQATTQSQSASKTVRPASPSGRKVAGVIEYKADLITPDAEGSSIMKGHVRITDQLGSVTLIIVGDRVTVNKKGGHPLLTIAWDLAEKAKRAALIGLAREAGQTGSTRAHLWVTADKADYDAARKEWTFDGHFMALNGGEIMGLFTATGQVKITGESQIRLMPMQGFVVHEEIGPEPESDDKSPGAARGGPAQPGAAQTGFTGFDSIKADSITSSPMGTTLYRGNVRLERKNFKISADEVRRSQRGRELYATGNPIQLELGPGVTAQGRGLTYDLQTRSTLLQDNAVIIQEDGEGRKKQVTADVIDIEYPAPQPGQDPATVQPKIHLMHLDRTPIEVKKLKNALGLPPEALGKGWLDTTLLQARPAPTPSAAPRPAKFEDLKPLPADPKNPPARARVTTPAGDIEASGDGLESVK